MSSSTRTIRSAARGRLRQTGAAAASPVTTSAPRAAPTAVAPPEPRPDWATTTLVSSTTRFEDLPSVTQGSVGAGTVCEASRVSIADGTACDAGSQTELVIRLNSSVTTLPPAPGMPNFLDVLRQAEKIRNTTVSSFVLTRLIGSNGVCCSLREVAQLGLVADLVAALDMTHISTVTDTAAPSSPRRRAWVTVDGRVLRRDRLTLFCCERLASCGTRRG